MSYRWVVLFLVHASDKNTSAYAKELFNLLKSTDYNKEIKILVLYGGLQYSPSEGYKIQVTLKEIVKDEASSKLSLDDVESGFGRIDMGDDKQLGKIFSAIRKQYPSDRFLLLTWDHGTGFGIFNTDPRERRLQGVDPFSIPPSGIEKPLKIITNYCHEGDTRNLDRIRGGRKRINTSMLTNDELRNIIIEGLQGKKVDLLIMINCTMQMIETGFALKDAVEYLVAPETCIFWAGFDYVSIINKLCTDPGIETKMLGMYAIDTIEEYYKKTAFKSDFNNLVVSLVRPSGSVNVKQVIDEVAGYLNDNLGVSFADIKSIRKQCDDLSKDYVVHPFQYIDLLSCIADLTLVSKEINLNRAKKVVEDYVIHIVKGQNYNKVNSSNNTGLVNGFSIYYPLSAAEADSDYYYEWFYKTGRHQTLFAAESNWKSFLINYVRTDRTQQKR